MKLKNSKLSEIDYKKVCVDNIIYTLFVDRCDGNQAHILLIDGKEQVKGEIQAFVREINNLDFTITGWFDMFLYVDDNDYKTIKPFDIKELEVQE